MVSRAFRNTNQQKYFFNIQWHKEKTFKHQLLGHRMEHEIKDADAGTEAATDADGSRNSHGHEHGNCTGREVIVLLVKVYFKSLKMKLDNLEYGTIIFIFIVIFTTFWLMCSLAFFKCFLSKLGAYEELWTKPFI